MKILIGLLLFGLLVASPFVFAKQSDATGAPYKTSGKELTPEALTKLSYATTEAAAKSWMAWCMTRFKSVDVCTAALKLSLLKINTLNAGTLDGFPDLKTCYEKEKALSRSDCADNYIRDISADLTSEVQTEASIQAKPGRDEISTR